ncbi:hypothetical protein TELCIR_21659, partial [Teladorsagia circumcincta]
MFTDRNSKCIAKRKLSGHHLGIGLGVPHLLRHVLSPSGTQENSLVHVGTFVLSFLAFYPYAKDFCCLCRCVGYAVQRRFFKGHRDLILTFVILYIYMSVVMVEFLDISVGVYCPQYLLGIPLLFPNINFPLLLYLMHSYLIQIHKKMPLIIYE